MMAKPFHPSQILPPRSGTLNRQIPNTGCVCHYQLTGDYRDCRRILDNPFIYFAVRIGMIKFILMVNKQGQTRLASYFDWYPVQERVALETEIIRRCLLRTEYQCSFLEYRGLKVIYRRYASLFFVVAVDGEDENELAVLEFIHSLVETLDRYFVIHCQ